MILPRLVEGYPVYPAWYHKPDGSAKNPLTWINVCHPYICKTNESGRWPYKLNPARAAYPVAKRQVKRCNSSDRPQDLIISRTVATLQIGFTFLDGRPGQEHRFHKTSHLFNGCWLRGELVRGSKIVAMAAQCNLIDDHAILLSLYRWHRYLRYCPTEGPVFR